MNDELLHHWALRNVDDEAARWTIDLGKLPGLRRAHEVRIASAQKALSSLDACAEQATKRRRELEREIAAFDAQEKRFDQQLGAVTDQKQFQAVQHEIAAVRAKRSDVETVALECLEVEEQCAHDRPAAAGLLERAQQDSLTACHVWDADEARVAARLEELNHLRGAAAAALAPAARALYERLRGARDGRAIAAIENGACGACFHSLSPHASQEARKREHMIACDGCGRLLMLAPEPGA